MYNKDLFKKEEWYHNILSYLRSYTRALQVVGLWFARTHGHRRGIWKLQNSWQKSGCVHRNTWPWSWDNHGRSPEKISLTKCQVSAAKSAISVVFSSRWRNFLSNCPFLLSAIICCNYDNQRVANIIPFSSLTATRNHLQNWSSWKGKVL